MEFTVEHDLRSTVCRHATTEPQRRRGGANVERNRRDVGKDARAIARATASAVDKAEVPRAKAASAGSKRPGAGRGGTTCHAVAGGATAKPTRAVKPLSAAKFN